MAKGGKVFVRVARARKCQVLGCDAAAAAASTVAHRMIGNGAKREQTREER